MADAVSIGKTIRIAIPDVDRAKGDCRNILGVVLEVTGDNYYRIGTRTGKLNKVYARSQFTVSKEALIDISEVPDVELPLRSIVTAQSNGTGQGIFHCNCKTCSNKRCKCRKAEVLCNSRCHKSTNCCNK